MSTLLNKANAIKTEKDTYLKPRNIKSGVEVFGTTGIYTGTAQPDIYTQLTEPQDKNGLWVKCTATPAEIISDDNVTLDPYWNNSIGDTIAVKPYATVHAFLIGNEIFFMEGENGTYKQNQNWKYSFATNSYTQIANMPFGSSNYGGYCCASDGERYIYVFCASNGSSGNWAAFKYDTTNDTFTQIASTPYGLMNEPAIYLNGKIYIFYSNHSYCYNPATNSYSQIANCPATLNRLTTDGEYIYMFYNTNAYKYDAVNDTYTQLANVPFSFTTGSICYKNEKVYIFSKTNCYVYDIATDAYTQLADVPTSYSSNYDSNNLIKDNVEYLFTTSKVQTFQFPAKNYTNNSVVIEGGHSYRTSLVYTTVTNGLPYYFNNVYYYTTTGGLNEELPAYYGNGTEWVGIRNPAVLSVELNKASTIIAVGGTETLTATVKPTNATTKTVTWSSSDGAVATVDSSGEITGVATGTATITVTTTDGGFTDTCTVNVIPDLEVHIS